jgi:hypothetical protein
MGITLAVLYSLALEAISAWRRLVGARASTAGRLAERRTDAEDPSAPSSRTAFIYHPWL